MKNRVKITTLEWILDIIYPCYCKGCGKIGESFCDCCIFDNIKKNPPFSTENDRFFRRIVASGLRVDLMKKLVSEYKFLSRRHYARALAKILVISAGWFFPNFRSGTDEKYVLVSLPTISKHIRARGFDHIGRLCEEVSAISGVPVARVLKRRKSGVQVGKDAKTREKQAKEAYLIDSKVVLDKKSYFILVDDVWTTGASMRAAGAVLEAELLRLGVKKEDIKISAICLSKNSGYEF